MAEPKQMDGNTRVWWATEDVAGRDFACPCGKTYHASKNTIEWRFWCECNRLIDVSPDEGEGSALALREDKARIDWMQTSLASVALETDEGVVVQMDYIEQGDEGEEVALALPIDGEWPNLRAAIDKARGVPPTAGRQSIVSEKASER